VYESTELRIDNMR